MLKSRWFVFAGLLCALSLAGLPAAAHEMQIPVIVDTDMGPDDQRALGLLLNSPHVKVLALVASDGICPPGQAANKAARLLSFFKAPSVPIGAGPVISGQAGSLRKLCNAAYWGKIAPTVKGKEFPPASRVVSDALKKSPEKAVYLALGPLTTLAALLKENPRAAERISTVVYVGSPEGAEPMDFNTARDPKALRSVAASGLEMFIMPPGKGGRLDAGFLEAASGLKSPAAELLALQAEEPAFKAQHKGKGLPIFDELAVLWVNDPSLGEASGLPGKAQVQVVREFDLGQARLDYLELLAGRPGEAPPRAAVLFKRYPTDPDLYRPDVSPLVLKLIARHGYEEFKAILLTNELHRHLGIISIVGAKMGIRARELLGAGLDDLQVTSLAGNKPPLSCFNDGLQASTGASLGRGTIDVEAGSHKAAARFRSKSGRAVTLEVKPEVMAKIKGNIKALVKKHPGLTPIYFQKVRKLALQYWLEMDRKEIFQQVKEH